ncbi:MAG TPA: hypothetical protein PLP42_05510 [Acidobacteriota bacterium]|nr:hypothetical protein [Acidobacteriota bacterium]
MNHVLERGPGSRSRPKVEVSLPEARPDAESFQAFGVISRGEKYTRITVCHSVIVSNLRSVVIAGSTIEPL